jgi:hypothetical protein
VRNIFSSTRIIVFTLLAAVAIGPLGLPVVSGVVYADAKTAVCAGISATANGSCATGGTSLDTAVKFGIQTLGLVAGIIGVIMVIIGGMKYMTSQGDGSQISAAKNTIIYAVVGLVIAALSQFIVHFVLTKANGQQACSGATHTISGQKYTANGTPCK